MSCHKISNKRKIELWSMIKSNNKDSIINATVEIQKVGDTSMVGALLYKPYDPRVLTRINYKGMSVYQIKMLALGFITGKKPPQPVTYIPDSSIVNFYIKETLR